MSGWLRTRIGLGLLSIAGVTSGHYLAYWFVAPDSHHREDLLEATGHAGESPFVVLALAALLATCFAVLGGRPQKSSGFLPSFVRLACLQTIAFVLLETGERTLVGTPVMEAIREPVLWLGIAGQIVVAAAGAVLLGALRRAAAFIATSAAPLRRFEISDAVARTIVLWSRFATAPWDARGPPLPS